MRFSDKVKELLREHHISLGAFEKDTGIHRRFFYGQQARRPRKATIMAIAYYLGICVEELILDTDAEDIWYE